MAKKSTVAQLPKLKVNRLVYAAQLLKDVRQIDLDDLSEYEKQMIYEQLSVLTGALFQRLTVWNCLTTQAKEHHQTDNNETMNNLRNNWGINYEF